MRETTPIPPNTFSPLYQYIPQTPLTVTHGNHHTTHLSHEAALSLALRIIQQRGREHLHPTPMQLVESTTEAASADPSPSLATAVSSISPSNQSEEQKDGTTAVTSIIPPTAPPIALTEENIELLDQPAPQLSELFSRSLSEQLGVSLQLRTVSYLDILWLMFKLGQLTLDDHEQQMVLRHFERTHNRTLTLEVAENYESQGSTLRTAGIIGGVASFLSGASYPVGHIFGEGILKGLGDCCFPSLLTMDRNECFDALGKMLQSISQGSESMSRVRMAFGDGFRADKQGLAEDARSRSEESRNTADKISDYLRRMENYIYQLLQSEGDTTRKAAGIS